MNLYLLIKNHHTDVLSLLILPHKINDILMLAVAHDNYKKININKINKILGKENSFQILPSSRDDTNLFSLEQTKKKIYDEKPNC